MIRKVLVVCEGNICRSPLACALLARALPHIGFSSAGTHARTGEGADPLVAEMARVRGVNLAGAHKNAPYTDAFGPADYTRLSADWVPLPEP